MSALSLLDKPWAVTPATFARIREVWPRLCAALDTGGPEAFLVMLGEEEHEETFRIEGTTAVIPVRGVLVDEPDWISRMFGDSTYQGIRENLREAVASPRVQSILLDVDSPGGIVGGTAAAFEAVVAANREKRTVAAMSGIGASAAYWIAAGASEIVAGADAMLGSIGVMARYFDFSKMDEEIGIKEIEVRSKNASKKNLSPATDEGLAEVQRTLDEIEEVMIEQIAQGRGVEPETVISDFGQGAIMVGRHAVDAGLADEVGTPESALEDLNAAAAA